MNKNRYKGIYPIKWRQPVLNIWGTLRLSAERVRIEADRVGSGDGQKDWPEQFSISSILFQVQLI